VHRIDTGPLLIPVAVSGIGLAYELLSAWARSSALRTISEQGERRSTGS
jgi:hypothetical protein